MAYYNNTNIAPTAMIADNAQFDDVGEIDVDGHVYVGGKVRIYRHHHDEDKLQWTKELEDHKVVYPLKIAHHAFIGYGALIMPGCSYIGENSVIGARAVVTKDIPNNEIWVGNPARFIRKRLIVNGVDIYAKTKKRNGRLG